MEAKTKRNKTKQNKNASLPPATVGGPIVGAAINAEKARYTQQRPAAAVNAPSAGIRSDRTLQLSAHRLDGLCVEEYQLAAGAVAQRPGERLLHAVRGLWRHQPHAAGDPREGGGVAEVLGVVRQGRRSSQL